MHNWTMWALEFIWVSNGCRDVFRKCFNLVKKRDTASENPLPQNQKIEVSKKKAADLILYILII